MSSSVDFFNEKFFGKKTIRVPFIRVITHPLLKASVLVCCVFNAICFGYVIAIWQDAKSYGVWICMFAGTVLPIVSLSFAFIAARERSWGGSFGVYLIAYLLSSSLSVATSYLALNMYSYTLVQEKVEGTEKHVANQGRINNLYEMIAENEVEIVRLEAKTLPHPSLIDEYRKSIDENYKTIAELEGVKTDSVESGEGTAFGSVSKDVGGGMSVMVIFMALLAFLADFLPASVVFTSVSKLFKENKGFDPYLDCGERVMSDPTNLVSADAIGQVFGIKGEAYVNNALSAQVNNDYLKKAEQIDEGPHCSDDAEDVPSYIDNPLVKRAIAKGTSKEKKKAKSQQGSDLPDSVLAALGIDK